MALSPYAEPFVSQVPTPNRSRSHLYPTNSLDIFAAVSIGSTPAVSQAITDGADVNGMDQSGWTPLMYAAHYGHYAVVRRLLKAGADPNQAHPTTGRTALMLAANNGHTRCIEQLVSGGADRSLRDNKCHDAVHFAVTHGHGQNKLISQILGFAIAPRRPSGITPNTERARLIAMAAANHSHSTSPLGPRPITGARNLNFDFPNTPSL